jgi:uncharacterized membrane protein YbaN (DUF454 family)
MSRLVFLLLGFASTTLGIVGAFLPLLPTTIFLILAAACFARSSPRLEAWLLDHRTFGPLIRNWRETGAIPRPAKAMAVTGMVLGFAVFWVGVHPKPWLAAVVALALAGCAAFVVSRPAPGRPLD